ncbi:uncharacterized protein LOC101159415 [Oryzias latipes]|uniref:uncharacterized protein LOC101159415 n=1 Tax=Oryzias latipes TaxID=8090 RepID=UPI0000EA0A5F|nr:uncharacterized protein LOC101159415 [Oryzias latipes]
MELIGVALAVICLLSAGQSAPVSNCEELVQHLHLPAREEILGKWVFIGESTDVPSSALMTKMFVDSVWLNLTAADQEDSIMFTQIQKSFGICTRVSSSYTLRNNAFHMVYPIKSRTVLLRTSCPDCLVFNSNFSFGGSLYSNLQFLSRRREVSAAEKEEFKRQTECLNLPQFIFLDSKKELCPDPSSDSSNSVDLTSKLSLLDFDQLDKTLRNETEVQKLIDMGSSQLSTQ